ncbi:hypothetical protein ADIS_3389 [Lunatimonas lonarensis]|uniref:Uncharacterized protein n=1 Tax=Lunatimonas lonarensis TaxID=1232681 RepID=R7ZQ53_9BACT|nr:hypothetical protein [Lunatimonas lonarensis]EON76261.1 hypothetical protein ADIS_3389 [Lunatimonas lonarensis]
MKTIVDQDKNKQFSQIINKGFTLAWFWFFRNTIHFSLIQDLTF